MRSDEKSNHDKQDKYVESVKKYEKGGYPAGDFR